jgi:TPR repeat protein
MDFNLKEHFPEGIQIFASSHEIQVVANKIYEESVDSFKKHKFQLAATASVYAIRLGNADAVAFLAYMLTENRPGVPQDIDGAIMLASFGKDKNCHHCMSIYAFCSHVYCHWRVFEKEVLSMILRSSEAGSQYGMYAHAFLLKHGDLISKDRQKMLELMERAGEMGHCDALYHLGLYYSYLNRPFKDEDKIVPTEEEQEQETKLAEHYFKKAVSCGCVNSARRLQEKHCWGRGYWHLD